MRTFIWHKKAQEQYLKWSRSDKKAVERINKLLAAILADPYHGIGKPEPLTADKSGYWSRRINKGNRIVYLLTEHKGKEAIFIAECGTHYSDK